MCEKIYSINCTIHTNSSLGTGSKLFLAMLTSRERNILINYVTCWGALHQVLKNNSTKELVCWQSLKQYATIPISPMSAESTFWQPCMTSFYREYFTCLFIVLNFTRGTLTAIIGMWCYDRSITTMSVLLATIVLSYVQMVYCYCKCGLSHILGNISSMISRHTPFNQELVWPFIA